MPSILWLLGASGETLEHTKDFILVFLIGSPFVIANFTLGQTVRAEGAAKESMIGMIISVIVNIILDPIFIFLLNMDVMGAAIATVISNIVSVAYYMYFLNEKSDIQSINNINIYQEYQISELYIYILSIQKMRQSPTNRNE